MVWEYAHELYFWAPVPHQFNHDGAIRSTEKALALSFPTLEKRARSVPSETNWRMASDRAAMSSCGTNIPLLPPSRISAGPYSQSKLTTGHPFTIASMITFGDPSECDGRTKQCARRYQVSTSVTTPGRCSRDAIPSSCDIASSVARSVPRPRITR